LGEVAMVVIVEPAMESLNTKSAPPPAPVSTNLFPLSSETTKLTLLPDCVSVTVPKTVPAAGHPVEIWHDVKLKVSADAFGAPTISRRKATTIAAANVMRFI
jgi:hypothetical protein